MGIKEFAKNFLKEETTNSQALVDLDAKKSFTTLVTTAIILSPGSYQHLLAQNSYTKLPNKVLIEHLTRQDYDAGSYFYDAASHTLGKEEFAYLRLPYQGNNFREQWLTPQSEERILFHFRRYNYVPQIVVNGKSNKDFSDTYKDWEKTMAEQLKNKKDNVDFSILEDKEKSSFNLEIQTKDKELINSKDLNLVVISFQDFVNNASVVEPKAPYNNPDYLYRNIARDFPFGAHGQRIIFDKDGNYKTSFKLSRLFAENRQMTGLIFVLEKTQKTPDNKKEEKKVSAVAVCYLANLDGIDKPMYLNWGNQPENIRQEEYSKNNYEKIKKYTGLQEMILNVKDIPTNTDLKKIGLEIGKSGNDSDFFDILGYTIPQSLQENIKYLDFDPATSRLEIEFIRPLTHLDPETPIFTYITHFKKNTHQVSFNFQSRNLQVLDSKNCIPYFYLNNPKIHHRNQLLVSINLLDFNKDTWINEHDLSHLIDRFGTNENDKNWDPIYDIHQGGVSKGRIDIGDIRKMINENNRQNRFKEIIKEQNPDAELDSVSLDIKSQVIEQLSQILPPSKPNLLQSIFSFFKKK